MPNHEIRVDLRIYPLLAIQKAAAAFTDRYVVAIRQPGTTEAALDFTERPGSAPLPNLHATFHDRLLDLTLQERVAEQTKDIRLALVRAALSEALPAAK